MRNGAALLALFFVAACTTTGPRSRDAHWLVGTWLMLGPDIEYPLACSSGLPIAYNANGTYDLFEDSGTWRLEGERLTEVATQIHDSNGEGSSQIGRPYVSRISRTGTDEFRKTYTDGSVETFRRCPRS